MKTVRPILFRVFCFVALLLIAVGGVMALPHSINYQGLLVDDGVPVQGTKSVRFRIYDSAEGGTHLWEEAQSVAFSDGVFSVNLGSTDPIPESVFDGSRRWISVSIEGGPDLLPRGEIVSVGYAFFSASSDAATDADLLDGFDSSQFAGSAHSHDSRYYTQNQINTSDGSPPNQGSNLIHWNILNGVPDGFADGVDNVGESGPIDHGELTGLLDDDHPQYALKDSIKTSDGTPPNQGKNLVHWNILGGVPSGLADGVDNITQDASLITSGTMSPERIEGTAVVDTDPRLLNVTQKGELTGGGETSLHAHTEVGDISSVAAGEGLTGGGDAEDVTLSHAQDATSLPFAHHYPPVVAHSDTTFFESNSTVPVVARSVTVDAPADGFLYISFSGTQKLDVDFETPPPEWLPKRYIANYGVAVDTTLSMEYFVTSSMQDTLFWGLGAFVPSKPVAGSTVRSVSQGTHTVYLLTEITLIIDADADNNLENPSLTAIYLPYDTTGFAAAMLGAQRTGDQSGGQADD